jgi:hypothetical protein
MKILVASCKQKRNPNRIQAFLESHWQTEDSVTHTQLTLDLIER